MSTTRQLICSFLDNDSVRQAISNGYPIPMPIVALLENDPLVQEARSSYMLRLLSQTHQEVSLRRSNVKPFIIAINNISQDETFAATRALEFLDQVTTIAWNRFKEKWPSPPEPIGTVHTEPMFWSAMFFQALKKDRKKTGTILIPNGCCKNPECGITKFYFVLAACWNEYCAKAVL